MSNKDPKRPRYWYCIIGPVPDDDISSFGDGPPRAAARDAIRRSTGHDPTCSSGWIEEADAEAMQRANLESTKAWLKSTNEEAPE